jgi:hypothetical protein
MRITARLNNIMRYLTLLFAILLSACSASAQEADPDWVAKPVVCGTVESISEVSKSKGLELTFGGNGLANSVNTEQPASVYVFLAINPTTKEWALQEVSGDEACVIGYGTGFTIDADTMKKLSKPTT